MKINWRACFWMTMLGLFVVVVGLVPTPAHAMTRTQVKSTLTSAARYYHLSAAKTRWIVAKGLHIAWGESRYHTNTGHLNGCYGLFQFGPGWKHHITIGGVYYADFRKSGRGSAWRFVKVYKVGGKRAIRRYWRATY